jgi:hypothetical protein
MSILIPVEGKFLALTVVGKNSENTKLPFPADAVFTWAIDNPVIATISEITPGDGTIRKIAPNASGEQGTVKVTCTVAFKDTFDNDRPVTLTNTFTVLIGEELPTAVDFESTVEVNP